ncbi:MAG: dihydrodipicolinate synthase family protein, partial [Chthoniobacteraceae bacterium]
LGGVIAFPVTPFKKNLALDLAGLRRNIRKLAGQQVCAIVAGAGTGELHSLSTDEHLAVVKATLEEVKGRHPVLAGVGFSPQTAVDMARSCTAAGVDGILIFPPYYPGDANDEGFFAYYRNVAAATKRGVLIYSRDHANFSPAAVARLATIPNFTAYKDGQGDIRRFQQIITRVGSRLHWIGGAGDDCVPAYYSLGVRTYTSSIANVAPRLSYRLHELAAARTPAADAELAGLMRELVVPLYAFRGRRKGYEVSVMKTMMDFTGQTGGVVRPPLNDLRADEVKEIRTLLKPWRKWL